MSREQQLSLPRSSPESQTPREWEQGGGDSPRDRQGLGVLLAATGVESASFPEGPQLPPPPQSLTTATQMASSQKFREHSTESSPGPSPLRKRKASTPTPTPTTKKQKRPPGPQYTESSPGPSSLRKRKASTPTPTPTTKKQKRPPRPQYTKEQEDFIWFCRDDLAMSWRKVVKLYNDYWHPFECEPHIRSESGLQSRYYRILDFPVKIRKKKEPSRPDLGLIPSTNRRYHWMGVLTDDRESYTGGGGIVPGVIGVDGEGGGEGRSPSRKERELSSSSSIETTSDEPHSPHYNTPTRSSQQTNLRPSNLLTSIDQPGSGGYECSRITSPTPSPPNPTPHQHQSRCTYPRPPDPQMPLGTLSERTRGLKSSDPVLIPRRGRTRDSKGEGQPGAERERRRGPDTSRVDPRLSVTSLCV